MNFITCIIFCLILWFNGSHSSNEHLKSYRNSDRHFRMHRNVISNDVVSSAVQPISTSFNTVAMGLLRSIRITRGLSSIFCNSTNDCKHISPTDVCVYYTPISVSLCLPQPVNDAAISMAYSKIMIYTFMVFGLVLKKLITNFSNI
jgi:hypothetical protein